MIFSRKDETGSGRRAFFRKLTATMITLAIAPARWLSAAYRPSLQQAKPATNIRDTLKYPRNSNSMPGRFPGKVVQVTHANCTQKSKPVKEATDQMLRQGLMELTGTVNIRDAWKMFFSADERIGIKVNPVAGRQLSTSIELVKIIIEQLMDAGIPRSNLVIWDRRVADLKEAGFKANEFRDLAIRGTEIRDNHGNYFDNEGKLYSESMIDKNWYYWADTEVKYDSDTIIYMVNEGKYSYFSKIVTQELDKIINVPVLKNAGASATIALKNLAYGSITNTGRLHKELWAETCAEVCAFPPIRDKVVLNIVDGIKGCYQGGPAANPQFITEFKTLLLATDPVAADRVGYEIILKKRMDEKIQKEDDPAGRRFLELASSLGLGVSDLNKIELRRIALT